eukprot:SAG11_NODE_1563_length_4675_cov_10.530376_2_plen_131_part_00
MPDQQLQKQVRKQEHRRRMHIRVRALATQLDPAAACSAIQRPDHKGAAKLGDYQPGPGGQGFGPRCLEQPPAFATDQAAGILQAVEFFNREVRSSHLRLQATRRNQFTCTCIAGVYIAIIGGGGAALLQK